MHCFRRFGESKMPATNSLRGQPRTFNALITPFRHPPPYCRSYSPLPTFFNTVKPAFLASENERVLGELKVDMSLRTGFLQAGHLVNSCASSGRRKVNLPPQTLQSPSHNSYS